MQSAVLVGVPAEPLNPEMRAMKPTGFVPWRTASLASLVSSLGAVAQNAAAPYAIDVSAELVRPASHSRPRSCCRANLRSVRCEVPRRGKAAPAK